MSLKKFSLVFINVDITIIANKTAFGLMNLKKKHINKFNGVVNFFFPHYFYLKQFYKKNTI